MGSILYLKFKDEIPGQNSKKTKFDNLRKAVVSFVEKSCSTNPNEQNLTDPNDKRNIVSTILIIMWVRLSTLNKW